MPLSPVPLLHSHPFGGFGIRDACEGALRRLQSDYIDVFLLHNRPHEETLPVAMETMAQLKSEGKIRWSGISYTAGGDNDSIRKLMEMGEVAAMVVGYNMMARSDDRIRFAKEENIGTMIASPLNSGILSGRWFDDLSTLDPTDRRYERLASPKGQEFRRKLSELRFLTESGERTMTQAALRFILDVEGVTSLIPGALRPSEIEENAGAADVLPLTDDERARAISIADEATGMLQG